VTRTSMRTPTRAASVNQASQMPNDPQVLLVLATLAGVLVSMTWLAVRMNMIELRRPSRCPACGRDRIAGTCRCSG
jgi:hypothetical protein